MTSPTAYLSSAYLAPIQYYQKLSSYTKIVIEQYDHYIKQTYRNRCYIVGAEGIQNLTIPIIKPSNTKSYLKDIQISNHGNWKHIHWNAIKSSYNKSPYFEYYEDDLAPFYHKENIKFLLDFNEQIQQKILKLLEIHPQYSYSTAYKMDFSPLEHDFRELIHPKKDFKKADPKFISKAYYQVFQEKHGFIPNLSILDLLFNKGPESVFYLNYSLLSE